MTSFYEDFADHYDTVFPAELEIVSFLAESMKGKRKLLDVACGTGSYALELASRGHSVTGIDLEDRMIKRAKEKTYCSAVSFHVADMTGGSDLDGVFARRFDGIYCIGNSLPHLGSMAQIRKAVSLWPTALENGGVLVLQTVNFGRFDAERETELPSIEKGGAIFSRRYEAAGRGSVNFVSTLVFPQTGKELTNSVRLLVINQEQIETLLRDAGLGELEYFGSYAGDVYEEGISFLLICRARKLSRASL